MIVFFTRRLVAAALTVLVALVLVFLLVRLLPNNPVLARFGQHADPQRVVQAMQRQGYDQPLAVQLRTFLTGLFTRGDLGESFFVNESVTAGLRRTFPATVELSFVALVLALPLGISAGIAAAIWRNRWPDYLCMTGSLLGVSIPVFFLGICLLFAFPGMPIGRRIPAGMWFDSQTGFVLFESLFRGRWDVFTAALRHVCLPAIALSTIPAAIVARITRSSMLEVLSADYVRTSRAKGANPWRVVWRHALPNAAIPVTNIAGLQAGQLLAGAVLTESVFDWPGLGRYLVTAVQLSDYNVVQGGVLLVATVFVLLNLVLDVVYLWLDPRFRGRGAQA